MKKDEEYVVTGLFSAVNAPFLYRKGTLIALSVQVEQVLHQAEMMVVNWWNGGGINLEVRSGTGPGGGSGGVFAGQGTLTGIFGGLLMVQQTGGLVPSRSKSQDVFGSVNPLLEVVYYVLEEFIGEIRESTL